MISVIVPNRIGYVLSYIAKGYLFSQQQNKATLMVFEQFFYENPFPCWIFAVSDLSIVAVNRSACERYGYTEEEMIHGMTILDLRPEEGRQKTLQYVYSKHQDTRSCWNHVDRQGNVFRVVVNVFDTQVNGRKCRFVMITDIDDQPMLNHRKKKIGVAVFC